MPVDDLTGFDFISLDLEGNVILIIADHLEWDEANTHLLILQNKINAYLEGIENGSLENGYPNAKGRNIIIRVAMKYTPSDNGSRFLKKTQQDLISAGYGFDYSVWSS